MLNSILGSEIIKRLIATCISYNIINGLARCILITISQKRRTGLRAKDTDMVCAVIFLILTGTLMFFDDAVAVIFCGGGADHAGLNAALHLKLIDIEVFLFIQHKGNLFAQAVKAGFGLGIDPVIVQIDPRFQVDLGTGNVKERPGIAFSQGGRFGGIHHIIGNCCDFVCFFRNGKKSVERKKFSHDTISL